MGKHPSISILWGKCYGGLFTRRRRNRTETMEEPPPPPPPVDIITNTDTLIKRHPAKSCAHPPPRRPIPDLPPDIITNILVRLPPKCIFQLRQQTNSSDLLYHLTTNPHFLRTNLDRGRATQTIVVQSITQSVGNVIKLFVSPDGRSDNIKPIIPRTLDLSSCNAYCTESLTLCGSRDGFLLFRCRGGPKLFCVWNPITKEQAVVTPDPNYSTRVCGFYFHPLKREYEVLCVRISAMAMEMTWEFQIIGLRSKRKRSVGHFSYGPSKIKSEPVFINGTLYWIVDYFKYLWGDDDPSLSDSILTFNIETEEFSTMEVVEPSNTGHTRRRIEYVFQLFELEGHLCLFDSSSKTDGAFIWELNYDNTKRWVKKHSLMHPQDNYWLYCVRIEYIKMTGELIAYDTNCATYKTPYVYNLRRHGLGRQFERNGFANDSIRITTHTHSLVSLGAADSVIPIEW